MCGIVGYVGRAHATPILLDGLRRLEYRGYDSAGLAIIDAGQLDTRKCAGRIASLAKLVKKQPVSGSLGISHTRWATHGKVNDENAHPHFDASGKLALVHNGVIENYQALKDELIRSGDTNFRSDTDTEVLAHLIGKLYYDSCASTVDAPGKKARLFEAVRTALRQVIGTYGIALVHADVPDFMIGARRGSPLVLGVGNGENFLASDVSAIVAYTRDAVYLNDFDVVAAGPEKFEITSLAGDSTEHPVSKVEFTAEDIRKGDYPHYMLKEIFEQPNTVRDAMRGRLNAEECTAKLGGLNMAPPELRDVGRIVLTGCGTALHAGRVGEYLLERLANIPTEVDYASEFRHRNTPMTGETLVFAISQSGETADTLEGALKMKEITYLFAEGHPSAELKHGIIALIRPDLPSIFIAPDDSVFPKNLNNIEQVKARKGPIIALTSGNCAKHLKDIANDIVVLPEAPDYVTPILNVVPLQLLAYHLAVELGRDVDKPRNLAKSVTVE